jgi:iron complex transport system permease protein
MGLTVKEAFIYLIPLPLMVFSLFLGPADLISAGDVMHWLANLSTFSVNEVSDNMVTAIVYNVRLPRIILAFMIGAALSSSGNAMQSLFRNPLVSPDILGLSSGAAFGAALALAFPFIPVQLSAFIFGLLAVSISYFLARTNRGVPTVSLILSGVIISAAFTALLTIVQFLTDPFKLQTIVHWTMGNLHNANWSKVKSSFFPIVVANIWLFFMRWRLNVIAHGDEETKALGLNPEREKLMILIPASLAASSAVAVGGIIAMIGLVIPHMIRMLIGPDNQKTQPLSMFFGGSFLLVVDDLSRTTAAFEIPIGIFTTLLGAPFFIYLLKRGRIIYREI